MLPTVHYNMGGIPTNHLGEALRPTESDPDAICPGLMAIGEAACVSVHGANRLGANSLLDIVVFGRAAALRAAELYTAGASQKPLAAGYADATLSRFDKTAPCLGVAEDGRNPVVDAARHAEQRRRLPHPRGA